MKWKQNSPKPTACRKAVLREVYRMENFLRNKQTKIWNILTYHLKKVELEKGWTAQSHQKEGSNEDQKGNKYNRDKRKTIEKSMKPKFSFLKRWVKLINLFSQALTNKKERGLQVKWSNNNWSHRYFKKSWENTTDSYMPTNWTTWKRDGQISRNIHLPGLSQSRLFEQTKFVI